MSHTAAPAFFTSIVGLFAPRGDGNPSAAMSVCLNTSGLLDSLPREGTETAVAA